MAARTKRSSLLIVAAITTIAMLAPAVAARAENSWYGGYRKFPWKAGTTNLLSTLPGECPHCPGSESNSAWKALDVGGMDYEPLYSISPGTIDYTGYDSAAGNYMRVRDEDGTYITYEHLNDFDIRSGTVVPGQSLGVTGCSGRCYGAHLHMQRQSGASFGSTGLDLTEISGRGGSGDTLTHASYTSDNAGVGNSSSGYISGAIRTAYKALNGYDGVGVTADLGEQWSPCREDTLQGTWWRYWCASNSNYSGSLQTFTYAGKQRALMVADGSATAYMLYRGILGAYTEQWNGHDWVYWIGYPTENRRQWSQAGDVFRQDFQNGYVLYYNTCVESVYIGSTWKAGYHFCD